MILGITLCKAEVNITFEDEDGTYIKHHNSIVDQFYQGRKSWKLSKLGSVLYQNLDYPKISKEKGNKTFVILIWKHWKVLQNRHLYYFGPEKHNPLEGCSVTNCEFTGDDSKLESADAVIVHLHRGQIPSLKRRNASQRWIFLNDEAPYNAFLLSKNVIKLRDLHNIFNWSMTYSIPSGFFIWSEVWTLWILWIIIDVYLLYNSSNADVPVPYGRTIPLKMPKLPPAELSLFNLVPNWNEKRRDVPAAILFSNCVSYRLTLIKQLKKFIPLDAYGACGDTTLKKSCPGHFRADCKVISKYMFYLALENSKCIQYMTEKLFHNAYYRGAIPIIQGPSIIECKQYLPPNSYLHVDNYPTIKDLADDILRISKNDTELLSYHKWRNHFEIANEHGYFGTKSFHLCRACEAMNYNDENYTVYSEQRLKQYLDPSVLCRA